MIYEDLIMDYCGLGKPQTIRVIEYNISSKFPNISFLFETKKCVNDKAYDRIKDVGILTNDHVVNCSTSGG